MRAKLQVGSEVFVDSKPVLLAMKSLKDGTSIGGPYPAPAKIHHTVRLDNIYRIKVEHSNSGLPKNTLFDQDDKECGWFCGWAYIASESVSTLVLEVWDSVYTHEVDQYYKDREDIVVEVAKAEMTKGGEPDA